MACIYKITNICNGMVYIGQTTQDISTRWKFHCWDARKSRYANRPLYAAMRSYGIDNFRIDVIEECSTDDLPEREAYWINHYDSYHNGYNATLGGNGKRKLDYTAIFTEYKNSGKNCKLAAEKLGICKDTVRKAAHSFGEATKRQYDCKGVTMLTLSGDYLMSFPSVREASRYLVSRATPDDTDYRKYSSHISSACSGKRNSCCGYKWCYS